MKKSFKISVLIPCHSLKYLTDSIASIANQTLGEDLYEVILVGDRIDLEEAERILSNHISNFRILKSELPGIVNALNLGLTNIDSPYVARLDDDDLMTPDRLEKQLLYLEKNVEVVAVGGQIKLIGEDGMFLQNANFPLRVHLTARSLFTGSPVAHPASMFRCNIVKSIGGYRDFLPEDWDLWVRLREIGLVENLPDVILQYRVHPNQQSRNQMYGRSSGRGYVSASFFARAIGISDSPKEGESKSDWLDQTQRILREISPKYKKFERWSVKQNEIESIFETKAKFTRLRSLLILGAKYPITISRVLAIEIIRRIRIFLK